MHQHRDRHRVFIHGAGRRGTDAWPTIETSTGSFIPFPREMSVHDQTAHLAAILADAPTTVFAHSIGAVPAVLAASSVPDGRIALVLVEPALYDIARGDAVIERHIAAVAEARSQAIEGDLRASWGILRPLMFGGPIDMDQWDEERALAKRWSSANVPWGHGIRQHSLDGIPTLIVTGGWNDEYERIAEKLSARGAEHVVLTGAEHRPQDLAAFTDVVRAFESRVP